MSDPQAQAREKAADEQERERAPHDAIAKALGDVTERDRAEGVADEEDGAERSNGGTATALRRDIHQERRERRVQKAMSAASQEPGHEEERQDGTTRVGPR